MAAEVHILSYFSLETDLAAEFEAWPEFRSGSGYNVQLSSDDESVEIEFVPGTEDESPHVRVSGSQGGALFDRALGRATHALAAHSDSLMIDRLA